MSGLTLLVVAALWGAATARAIGTYSTLVQMERVVLWLWVSMAALFLLTTLTTRAVFAAAMVVPLVAVGLLVLLNVQRVADNLATREIGIWPLHRKYSVGWLRLNGAVTVLAGALLALDPGALT
jgi:hypothetical protein